MLPRMVLAYVCFAVLAGPDNAQSQSSGFPDGLTRGEVESVLGRPATVVHVEGEGETEWNYETLDGIVTIRFENDKATVKAPVGSHAHAAVARDPETAYRLATDAHIGGNDHDALLRLRECLTLNSRHRRCKNLAKSVLETYTEALHLKYEQATAPQMRKEVLEEILEVTESTELAAELRSVRNEIELAAKRSLSRLVDARAAIAAARTAITTGDFQTAARNLIPYQNNAIAASATHDLRRFVETEFANRIVQSRTLENVQNTLEQLTPLMELLGEEAFQTLKTKAVDTCLRTIASEKAKPRDAAEARALEEILAAKVPTLPGKSGLWPWNEIDGAESAIHLHLDVSPAPSCSESNAPYFQFPAISTSARPRIVEVKDSEIRISVSLECSVDTRPGEASTVSSTYVASYQQVVNPDYIRAQAALQEAQTSLAEIKLRNSLNPPANPWLAAAQGLAEGFAQSSVNKLFQKLQNTSPYLSEPIKLAYTAQRYDVTRTARVSAAVVLDDRATGFEEASYNTGSAESSDEVRQNVLPSDAQGLSNRSATLRSPVDLLRNAYESILPEIVASSRELLGKAFIERARRHLNEPLRLTGNLLIARDLSNSLASALQAGVVIDEIRDTPVGELSRVKLNSAALVFPSRESKGLERFGVSRDAARKPISALENALASVVTIKTETSLGSGFFVGNEGFLLTNSHVVIGAAKVVVYTSDGSSYLATVVKTSSSPDLALLKVSSPMPNVLSLANSDEIEVGTDVLAVGAARGLEGTVTKGIISAARNIGGVRYFQIDAAINPGNSGGPLLNTGGEVIGINTLSLAREGIESLAFAIAVNEARRLFSAFLK